MRLPEVGVGVTWFAGMEPLLQANAELVEELHGGVITRQSEDVLGGDHSAIARHGFLGYLDVVRRDLENASA